MATLSRATTHAEAVADNARQHIRKQQQQEDNVADEVPHRSQAVGGVDSRHHDVVPALSDHQLEQQRDAVEERREVRAAANGVHVAGHGLQLASKPPQAHDGVIIHNELATRQVS